MSGLEGVSLSRTFTGQGSDILCVSFAPSNKQVLSGSKDGSLMIWNFRPQQRAYRLRGHTGPVHCVQMAPNESVIASGSADRTVRLWRPSIQGNFKELKAHAGVVLSLGFSQDSSMLVTAGSDKMIRLWDVRELWANAKTRPKLISCFHGHTNWVRSLDLSQGAYRICSGSDDKLVKVWDVQKHECSAVFEDHSSPVNCVRFDPLSGVCAASASTGTVMLHDIRSQQLVQHYQLKDQPKVNNIEFHKSGNYLLSGTSDGAMRVWDLREGRILYTVSAHSKSVNSCAFSSDGDHFVSGSSDGLVLAWKCDSLNEQVNDAEPATATMDDSFRAEQQQPQTKHHHHHHHHHRKGSLKPRDEHHHHQHHHHHHHQSSSNKQNKPHKERRKSSHSHKTKQRRVSSKHIKQQDLFDLNEEVTAPPAPPPSENTKTTKIGEYTKAAARASMMNRIGAGSSTAGSVNQDSNNEMNSKPPVMENPNPFSTLARAMQNLEERLRLNEDAISELKLSASQA